MTAPPWEPPLAGTETEQLLGALDRQRWTFRWKADGLDRAGLTTRIGASVLTLGSLLKHLAQCEDDVIRVRLDGGHPSEPWASKGWDWAFSSAADDEPASLYELYDAAVARSRARLAEVIAAGGLDQPVAMGWQGAHASLRRLVCDLIEEYGRHTGHADLIREAVDGRVGEDPPEEWRPTAG